MDKLGVIINSLSAEEISLFKQFIQNKKEIEGRKDLQLFDALQKNGGNLRAEILHNLYPDTLNQVAYHATRKRLFKMLSQFIHLQHIQSDEHIDIASYYSVCDFLFKNRQDEIGWQYLKKGLNLSKKGKLHDLEIKLYQLAIDEGNSEYALDMKEMLVRYQALVRLRHEESQLQIIRQIARHELNLRLRKGVNLNFGFFIQNLNQTYLPNSPSVQSLHVIYNQVCIARSIVLEKKEFHTFEKYVIDSYTELLSRGAFKKETNNIHIHFLYMIAHTCYRNKKFDTAQMYLDKMHHHMLEYKKTDYKKYEYKHVLLQAAVHSYTHASTKAVSIIEKLLEEKHIQRNNEQYFNALINLGLNYFYSKNYSKTQRTFRNLQHTDAWFVKIMGQEWVLKKLLLEAINFYELEHIEFALEKIKYIEQNFNAYMNQDKHKRAIHFIGLFKKIIQNPEIVSTKSFSQLVDNTFTFLPHEEEDLQAMTFYAWLKSKMLRRDFYEVLLEIVKTK